MVADYTDLIRTMDDYKNAQNNVERIKRDYSESPELISFYLPSAESMVKELEGHLKYLLEIETKLIFEGESLINTPEIWVRIEGKSFKGRGPIGVVGSYLQKLNSANKHAVSIIGNITDKFENFKELTNSLSSFDLVATANGSLKLGLSRSEINLDALREQLVLFEDREVSDEDKTTNRAELTELSLQGVKLIAETVASVNDEDLFNSLKEKYGEKELQKLIHYTKELVPSNRSSFDSVSFEASNLSTPFETIKATRDTRKGLVEKEKLLTRESVYIEGEGWIRALDMDALTGTIRPLHYDGNITLDEVDFIILDKNFNSKTSAILLDKFVTLKGFLYFNQSSKPIRFNVEEISTDALTEKGEELID